MRRRIVDHPGLSAFVAFMLGALALTSPAWLAHDSSWPGYSGDAERFMSFIAWDAHALSHHINPLFNTTMNVPDGIQTAMPLPAIVAVPFTLLLGPVAAYTALLTTALALDGWCMFLWLRRHVRDSAAMIGAALVFFGPYVAIHAEAHLDLVMIFPLPLMFIATENIVRGDGEPARAGLWLGAATALALLCAQELAAIGIVVALVTVVCAWFTGADSTGIGPRIAAGATGAVMATLFLAAAPLIFQFFGPQAVHGTAQSPDVVVTDLLAPLVATPMTGPSWLTQPSSLTQWSGPAADMTAFIGLPLLLIAAAATWRRRTDPMVRSVATAAIVLLILSLGPHLHVNGATTAIPLPGILLTHLPLLPEHLSIAIAMGVAFLAAHAAEIWFIGQRRLGIPHVLALLLLLTLTPHLPLHAEADTTPAYFASSVPHDAGTILVLPFADVTSTSAADLWQARADFVFAMPEGYAICRATDGTAISGPPPSTLRRVFDGIRDTGQPPVLSAAERLSLRFDLRNHGLRTIVLGPAPHREVYAAFATSLAGSAGNVVDGVTVWTF